MLVWGSPTTRNFNRAMVRGRFLADVLEENPHRIKVRIIAPQVGDQRVLDLCFPSYIFHINDNLVNRLDDILQEEIEPD